MALFLGTTVRADTDATATDSSRSWCNDPFYYQRDSNKPLFSANELSLDFFGTYLNPERHFLAWPNTDIHRGTWGGGVGANYFWSKDVGLGVDTSMQDGGSTFFDHVGGNLMVRFPSMWSIWRLMYSRAAERV